MNDDSRSLPLYEVMKFGEKYLQAWPEPCSDCACEGCYFDDKDFLCQNTAPHCWCKSLEKDYGLIFRLVEEEKSDGKEKVSMFPHLAKVIDGVLVRLDLIPEDVEPREYCDEKCEFGPAGRFYKEHSTLANILKPSTWFNPAACLVCENVGCQWNDKDYEDADFEEGWESYYVHEIEPLITVKP